MKKNIIIIFAVFTILFAACAPTPDEASELAGVEAAVAQPSSGDVAPVPVAVIDTEFEDAANLRSQLAYGTMKLDGTPNAVSAEQAGAMLPLWQAIVALSGDDTTASEELTAVQEQIAQSFTAEQIAAINAMKITNTMLTAYYAELGISMPTPVPGVTKVPGSKKNMSEADKLATRTAAEAAGMTTGSGQATKTLLYEKVITYLANVAK